MKKVKTAMEYHDEYLISKGKIEGSFEGAIKVKREFGLEKALKLFDFTREELESEKVNRFDFTYP